MQSEYSYNLKINSLSELPNFSNTVKRCYNAVQYNMILHTSLQWLGQSINLILNPKKHIPYLTLTDELWDVFCVDLGDNWLRYNSTPLYTSNLELQLQLLQINPLCAEFLE